MRILRLEAPTGLTLKAYLFPFTVETSADPAGYALTETGARKYEVEIVDPTIFGQYRVVVEMVSEEITTAIDSGYVNIGSDSGTYVMSNKVHQPQQEIEILDPSLSEYGPKSVKTKEMEITQFSPMERIKAKERETTPWPTFCNTPACIGRGKNEYRK